MTHHARTWLIVYTAAALVILAVARTVNHLDKSPIDRAYRLCSECGLDRAQLDQLIDDVAHSTLDRDGLIQFFDATLEPEDDHRELCMPCVEAVLDIANVKP